MFVNFCRVLGKMTRQNHLLKVKLFFPFNSVNLNVIVDSCATARITSKLSIGKRYVSNLYSLAHFEEQRSIYRFQLAP